MESEELTPVAESERIVVCRRDELGPREMRPVTLGRRRIVLIRTEDGNYKAIADICPHEGARLSGGRVESMWLSDESRRYYSSRECSVIVCPWHNFEFDVDTGLAACEPHRMRVKTYPVRVEGEDVAVYI